MEISLGVIMGERYRRRKELQPPPMQRQRPMKIGVIEKALLDGSKRREVSTLIKKAALTKSKARRDEILENIKYKMNLNMYMVMSAGMWVIQSSINVDGVNYFLIGKVANVIALLCHNDHVDVYSDEIKKAEEHPLSYFYIKISNEYPKLIMTDGGRRELKKRLLTLSKACLNIAFKNVGDNHNNDKGRN